jgi:hypothetical protein
MMRGRQARLSRIVMDSERANFKPPAGLLARGAIQ